MFSAEAARGIEETNKLDFKGQFGAIDKAATILCEETLRRAEMRWPMAPRSIGQRG